MKSASSWQWTNLSRWRALSQKAGEPVALFSTCLIIFLLATAVRLALVLSLSPAALFYMNSVNGAPVSADEGINVAISLARNGEFADPFGAPTGPTAHVPPAFPFLTAAVFKIFGFGHTAAVVRHLIKCATFGLLFGLLPWFTGRFGLGQIAGIVGGLFGALVPLFRSSEVALGRDESLAGVLLMLATMLSFDLATSPVRFARFVLCGAVWGALLLVLPTVVVVMLAQFCLIVTLPVVQRERIRGTLKRIYASTAAIAVAAIVIAPWMVRNRLVFGEWFFIRDNFGLELLMSNYENAQNSQTMNFKTDYFCRVHPVCNENQRALVQRLGEVQFNKEMERQARAWIQSHPGEFLVKTVQRYGHFWYDLPSNGGFFVGRLVISLVVLISFFLLWRDGLKMQFWFSATLFVVYPLLYSLFQYSNRYVVPLAFAFYSLGAWTVLRLMLPNKAGQNDAGVARNLEDAGYGVT